MREITRRTVAVSQKLARVSLFVFLTLVALFSAFQVNRPEIATAASSSNLNFQARLLTSSGNTVPDGYYNIEFNLYNVSSGGSSLWTETYYDSNGVTAGSDNRLRVVNGYLSANLGSLNAFSSSINWDQEHWITMNIGGSAQTATPTYDGEMSPRLKLTAVPYAFKAGELAKTTGGNVSTLKFDTQTAANNILLPDEAGTLCIRSSVNCGFAASSGSANYIQNGTTGQTANFNIQSAANTSVVGVLQGAASQSADLLQFKDSSGTILTAFDSSGKLVFGPAGSQDTNLYRSAANTLKTDDALEVVGTLAVTGTQTFTGGGTFNGGLTVASNSNFSQTGSGTFGTGAGAVSLNGNTSVTGSNTFTVGTGTTTLGGNVVVNGSEFNNTGSTLNSALALGDLAAGSIGSAGTTVDIKTSFTISPTAGGRVYTIPDPTTATAGRIIYIQNINGSNSFTIGSTTFSPGSTSSYVWDGTAWRIVGAAAGVTTIGAIDGGTANANGATISGTTLYLQTADATYPGLISATTQTIAGAKTFTGVGTFSSAGTALSVTNDASIGGTGTIGTLNVTNGATIGTGLTVTSGGATITAGGLTVTAGGAGITGVTNINTTGANATTIGNSGATVALNGSTNTITGTTNINTTGTANTSIGNATGTLALTSSTFNLSTGGAISGVTDYAQASGNFLQSGTGTFGTGTGAVSLNGATSVTGGNAFNVGTGTSTFAGGNITQTGSGTFSTGTGSVSLNGDTTIASGKDLTITGGTGSQFTNNSSTLNSALALGDLAAGALGVNTATVDIKTSFTIAPTVAGRTYTIPTPSDTTAGRIIYISNVHGSNNFIIGSATFNSGTTGSFVWDGNGWRAAGIDTGVTTVGALNGGTANSTGATITGTTIYLQSASYTNPGVVDTGTQVFTGDKTIRSTSNSATAFSVQNSSSQSLFTVDTLNAGLSVGNAGLAGTIQIGNTTGAVAQTINIGNNATGSSTSTVVIGSTIGTSPVTIQSGTSGITANSTATTGTALGLSANALTTGTGFSVTSSSGNYISGNLANISQTATFTTAGISQTSSVINSSRTITANMSGTPTVTLDATTNGGSSASTTATWNHTIGNYTNRALVVAVGNWISNPSGNPTCTVTYGGISMTQYERRVNTSGSYTYTSFIYGLTAPAIGTASVSVSCSAGNTTVGESSSWYNVDQTTSFAGATGTTNGASPISLTVSGTTTNDKVVDSFWGGGTVLTPGAGQTAYGSYSGLAYASYKNGATTSTGVSYSQNSATQNAYTAMAVKAAAAASAGVTGAVQSISSNCVVSAGGCIDSANILSINQQYATSTGVALRIQNAGSGGAILAQSGSVNALSVQNAAGTSTNFNVDTTNGIVALGSTTYSTGSISQSTTTITGSGTAFTSGMTGGRIFYADGTTSTVTYVNGTSLTSSVSKTVPAGTTYRLVYGGLTTASGGATNIQTTTDSTIAFQIQSATKVSLLNADTTNMRISVGSIGTATSQFYVSGSLPTTHTGTVNTSASNDGPSSVAVQGRYAYVLNNATATLKAYDVSNPASPTDLTSSIGTGTAPNKVAIAGKYAYIVNSNTTSSQIKSVDITNPTSLAAGSTLTPSGTGNLSSIAIQGRYAYVTDSANNILRIIDITNPLNMVQVGSVTTTSTTPIDIAVQGKYAYVVFSGSSAIRKFDISDPTTPSGVGSSATSNSSTSIAIQGRYAYVTNSTANNMQIFDISSNTLPAAVGSVSLGTTPTSVIVQGRYAYVVNSGSATMQIIDVSNVASPTAITGTTTTNTTPSALTVSGRYAYIVNSGTNPDTLRTYDLGGSYIQQLEVGGLEADSITTRNDLTVGNNVSIRGGLNVGGSTQLGSLGVSGITNSGDLTFGEGATRNLNVQTRTSNAIGNALTISAGAAGSGASAFAGGALTLQGGAAGGTGNANGGAVTIAGGAAVGTGTQGLVNLSTSAFTSAAEQAFTSSTSITAGNVDLYSSLPVKANTNTGSVLTIPDPAQATIGRLLYVSARSGSLDFTMRLNSARTPIDIAMKQNSTATLIWNGTDWTAAGASSSTDLQSAYNNTLTSAGGAELVLNAPGGNADGLTIRNNATTPITGGILEVQTSIGSNLFSVNNNATEYATNGGAETQGASSSTFPASTWIAAPAGGTVSRNTTAANNATGTASVSVVTTTTSHGAADTLSAALTANLQYTVSFTAKGATNFSTLDVIYSRDGTNTSTTTCTTGKTVTTSIWSRITCTFTAPSSGISSLNAIFIRQSDATGRTFYIDNLSVNVNASVNHAADGSVDSALGTNWTDFGTNGSGTTTVARNTSIIYDTSGSVEKTTGATATKGIRNNMPITPSVSTQYLVTFYARSSNTFTDITAGFLPAGGDSAPAAAQLCTDYNTQTVSTSGWTKVTCIITTPSSGISDPDIVIYQPTGTARTFYVDALTVTLNTNTASNVQVGQGNKGGPTTLFTLDRSSTAPIADNNDAYLGSMYYDTTSGRIQCYEADGWGACGAAPDNIVNLNPEFAGAVLNGSGVGTMSADFCGNGGGLSVNTGLCTSGQARNFYKWTSPQASEQIYSIYVTYQLPASFKNFASDDTVQLTARTSNTTDGFVTYEMFRNESGSISACGTETTVTTTVDTWQTVGVNGNESTSCSFTTSSANAFVIFKINVKAKNNANVYVGTLSFTTAGR